MPVSSKAFDHGVNDLLESIHVCFERRLVLPALMLVYSTLDVMASLDRPELPSGSPASSATPVTNIGQQFKAWVTEFMKPKMSLKASPEEIWAWRNGLVHAYSFESNDTKAGRARIAGYCYGPAQLAVLPTCECSENERGGAG